MVYGGCGGVQVGQALPEALRHHIPFLTRMIMEVLPCPGSMRVKMTCTSSEQYRSHISNPVKPYRYCEACECCCCRCCLQVHGVLTGIPSTSSLMTGRGGLSEPSSIASNLPSGRVVSLAEEV